MAWRKTKEGKSQRAKTRRPDIRRATRVVAQGEHQQLPNTGTTGPELCPHALNILPAVWFVPGVASYAPSKPGDEVMLDWDYQTDETSQRDARSCHPASIALPLNPFQAHSSQVVQRLLEMQETATSPHKESIARHPEPLRKLLSSSSPSPSDRSQDVVNKLSSSGSEDSAYGSALSSDEGVGVGTESQSDAEPQPYEYDDGNSELFAHVTLRRKHHEDLRTRDSVMLDSTTVTSYFHMRQSEAAAAFGISLTAFKAACRKLGIQRWPYMRQKAAASAQTAMTDPDQEAGGARGRRRDRRVTTGPGAGAEQEQAGRARWDGSLEDLMEEALEHCTRKEEGQFIAEGK
ncbi:hypothetical protein GUITHDRAFT_108272 [Guillardia theta CCMP2712]|uniref:RWP-RK domain-containing protein n=1 Tax=Guillardia theta (strain CCMP2712) TaxID=905079 RepID=L1JBB6_GUITC|nr:hypothetical protein GUITHDRAFT_108272 [Guillardia theta CCMP2712]EKX45823.1 hypothetical protein GUITHDRAFT_108272 [Guillardia theta CCMP2712]|eukprot:XP_005832803.1 hypothetical protein GUITHDRAFT_108272 [Guillardia theta CCMP2712]